MVFRAALPRSSPGNLCRTLEVLKINKIAMLLICCTVCISCKRHGIINVKKDLKRAEYSNSNIQVAIARTELPDADIDFVIRTENSSHRLKTINEKCPSLFLMTEGNNIHLHCSFTNTDISFPIACRINKNEILSIEGLLVPDKTSPGISAIPRLLIVVRDKKTKNPIRILWKR